MIVIFSTIWIRIFYENKKFLHFPRTPRFPSMSIPNSPNSSINLFSISRSAILVAIPLKFAKILSAVVPSSVLIPRGYLWQLGAYSFASSYIWLEYIFEASYSMVLAWSAKNQVSTNQSSKNRWHLIVRLLYAEYYSV